MQGRAPCRCVCRLPGLPLTSLVRASEAHSACPPKPPFLSRVFGLLAFPPARGVGPAWHAPRCHFSFCVDLTVADAAPLSKTSARSAFAPAACLAAVTARLLGLSERCILTSGPALPSPFF